MLRRKKNRIPRNVGNIAGGTERNQQKLALPGKAEGKIEGLHEWRYVKHDST